MNDKYIVITWPDIQHYMTLLGFKEHSHLINDELGLETFGSSAYFIDEEWYDKAEELLYNNSNS